MQLMEIVIITQAAADEAAGHLQREQVMVESVVEVAVAVQVMLII